MGQLKKNILVLGIGQSNFLNQLYGGILKRSDSFNFATDVVKHLPNDTFNEASNVFPYSLNFSQYRDELSKLKKRLLFFNAIKKPFYLEIFLFELSQKKSLKKAFQVCQRMALKEYVYENHIKPKNFDVLHFHFCTKANLEYLHFIGNETKVICSFWGSDLFRVSDIGSNFYVSKALNNANIITVQSPEMALALKAKYGVHLSDKIKDVRFTINTETYDFIDLYRDDFDILNEFKAKYSFEKGKILVALGHNAFKENNHIRMIEALKSIPQEYKNKITFILHLSYGRKDDYLTELKNSIRQSADLDIKILENFMEPEEISKLRLVSDVMIHAPISDALSGTMTEVLYAGNAVIAGGWLPFGILSRNQIHFEAFDRFENLGIKLIQTIDKQQEKLLSVQNNIKNIQGFLFPERTSKDWIELFNTVIDE